MVGVLKRLLARQEHSKDTARKRLQLILVLDRIGLSPEQMDGLKRDLLQVVSNYLVVEEDSIQVDMNRSGSSLVLVSNIEIKDVIRATLAP